MNCQGLKRLFPALMSGELPESLSGEAEEHLTSCEECSREFEAYEARFFGQYEPAGKALAAAAKVQVPASVMEKFEEALKARLGGDCARIEGMFTAYREGELDKSGSEKVAEHLQACDRCSQSFESYESREFLVESAGRALSAAAKVAPPESAFVGFYQQVQAKIRADERRSTWRRMSVGLNVAALLVIGLSVGYLFNGSTSAIPMDERPESVTTPGPTAREPLPAASDSTREARPVSAPDRVRRFSLDNVRSETLEPGRQRRPGTLEVLQGTGGHGVEKARPLGDSDAVGF